MIPIYMDKGVIRDFQEMLPYLNSIVHWEFSKWVKCQRNILHCFILCRCIVLHYKYWLHCQLHFKFNYDFKQYSIYVFIKGCNLAYHYLGELICIQISLPSQNIGSVIVTLLMSPSALTLVFMSAFTSLLRLRFTSKFYTFMSRGKLWNRWLPVFIIIIITVIVLYIFICFRYAFLWFVEFRGQSRFTLDIDYMAVVMFLIVLWLYHVFKSCC